MINLTKDDVERMIEVLKNKSKPSFENGKLNRENSSFNTGLAEGIDLLYELLEGCDNND